MLIKSKKSIRYWKFKQCILSDAEVQAAPDVVIFSILKCKLSENTEKEKKSPEQNKN